MNEPQSTEDTERLPDRPTATSHELRLLPDRGDFVGELVPLPDRGDTVYELVPMPHPAGPPGLADDEIEPPIERHDPFAWMRNAPWMDRRLSASGRAAYLLRRDLEAFPVIEGRDPNHADLDAIVQRTVDYIVPIIRREQATDMVYEELEKRRADRIAATDSGEADPNVHRVGGLGRVPRLDPRMPPPPVPLPRPEGSPFTPVPHGSTSPPPFPAPEPAKPKILSTPKAPLLPQFWDVVPPDLRDLVRPIPGGQVIVEAGEPFILPGAPIPDPSTQALIHWYGQLVGTAGSQGRGVTAIVERDDIVRADPRYGLLEGLAKQAMESVGPGRGRVHGTHVHAAFAKLVKDAVEQGKLSNARTEVSYMEDGPASRYGQAGSLRVDVIWEDKDSKTLKIYELKTGAARLTERRVDRTLDRKYMEKAWKSVTVMELNPWRHLLE
jgi:hypothetical protein